MSRYPWFCAIESAIDVEAFSSERHRLAAGCTWNIPGYRAYRLLLPVYAGPYRMVGFETGVGPEALGGADGWAGGTAALTLYTYPVSLPCRAEEE